MITDLAIDTSLLVIFIVGIVVVVRLLRQMRRDTRHDNDNFWGF